nr:MAG: prophage protein [uncultured archaeon]
MSKIICKIFGHKYRMFVNAEDNHILMVCLRCLKNGILKRYEVKTSDTEETYII